MRNQWLHIPQFNLPNKSAKSFYRFMLPESMEQTVVFLNIVARHGGFTGRIVIRRKEESYSITSQVSDLRGNILTDTNN